MRILIVEDDALLAEGVARTVQQLGHEAHVIRDGHQASAALAQEDYALVVLDIGLPGVDGLALLRELRASDHQTPVLLLTARDSIGDRIGGLDLGADDYMVKPVVLSELAAHLRALLRRALQQASGELVHGPLRLNTQGKRAWLGANELQLTTREWRILEYLMRRPERVVSKEQIQQAAGGEPDARYNAVEVYISRLRSKLDPSDVRIRTVRGFGYMLEEYRDTATR